MEGTVCNLKANVTVRIVYVFNLTWIALYVLAYLELQIKRHRSYRSRPSLPTSSHKLGERKINHFL